ncbi:MAG: SIMPL domain-containing protein [Eubacterium sp.]|nr:SIMPL domain-containing protein [Eubacterium sp.]
MDRKITVKGIGHITAKPDYVIIHLTVEEINKKYEKAVEEAAKRINALTAAISKIGFNAEDLKTVDYSIQSNVEYKPNRKGIGEYIKNGFRCTNRLKLAFDFDSDKLSKTVNAITSCVADPRMNITFTVKDEEAVKDELLKSAGANARRRAEILCEAAGGKLGALVTVNYNWNELSILSPTRFDTRDDTLQLDEILAAPTMAPQSFQPDDVDLSDNAVFVWEIDS